MNETTVSFRPNAYRSCLCNGVNENLTGQNVRVAGWVENIRDHGGVQFLDLRDQYGVVQVVVHDDSLLHPVTRECVVSVFGQVILRDEDTINPKISTGTVEVAAQSITVLGKCVESLPFEPAVSTETREDVRLRYRFFGFAQRKKCGTA